MELLGSDDHLDALASSPIAGLCGFQFETIIEFDPYLPPGQLGGHAHFHARQPYCFQCLFDFGLDIGFGNISIFQSKSDIVENGFMGKKGVILEDHAQVALVDGGIVDPPALDEDVTLGRFLQSGNHPQNRCFAASRWAQEGGQKTVRNIQIDFMDRNHLAKMLGYTSESNCRRSIAVS